MEKSSSSSLSIKTLYNIVIENRDYSKWKYFIDNTKTSIHLPINPIDKRLFSGDTFYITDSYTNEVEINTSIIRDKNTSIPGVLILKNNKTFGKTENGKLYYKCIPYNKDYPVFLIPYEIKNIGFSKVFHNLYITFKFKEWNNKHPVGIIDQNIGPVDILENSYEYQLFCGKINTSIQKFNKSTNTALKNIGWFNDSQVNKSEMIHYIKNKYNEIIDRTDKSKWKVITIDPEESKDYDDGFSIINITENVVMLSIYIANVPIWLDLLDLWEYFSQRVSTVYLPNKKYPMIPTVLSDYLCSLQENNIRIAFTMDIFIDCQTSEIVNVEYCNSLIDVFKNYSYEEEKLLKNNDYKKLFKTTHIITCKYKYLSTPLSDSHDLVCYLMILMNFYTSRELLKHNNGIFRSSVINKFTNTLENKSKNGNDNKPELLSCISHELPDDLPEDIYNYFRKDNSFSCEYIDISKLNQGEKDISHKGLNIESYIHITSPIRRLVDLLNIIQFQENIMPSTNSEKAMSFYNKWTQQIEYINNTMVSIRRVQNKCSMIHVFNSNPEILSKIYHGYIYNKEQSLYEDTLYNYNVYLHELKIVSKITTNKCYDNYSLHRFKLFLFNDEDNLIKKIKISIV